MVVVVYHSRWIAFRWHSYENIHHITAEALTTLCYAVFGVELSLCVCFTSMSLFLSFFLSLKAIYEPPQRGSIEGVELFEDPREKHVQVRHQF